MSNSAEEIRIQQISEILETTRKKVDVLLKRVPDLMRLNSIDEIHPEENSEYFYKSLPCTFGPYEFMVNVPGRMPPMIPKKYEGIFDWHYKKFLPIHSKVQELILKKFAVGIGTALAKAASNPPAPGSLTEATIFGILKHISGEQSIYRLLLEIFGWEKKEKALPPIVTERDIGKIPEHIFERLTEIHRSFVFGNWIAAIALSRCLLEYAIVEQRGVLGINVYTEKKKKVRWLGELIEEIGEKNSALAARMYEIQEPGNRVMHPPKENAERKLPGEDDAKKCYENIREIIGELYGK